MAETVDVQLPEFIEFLFSRKPKLDCHFIVGNKAQGKPERIGAVRLMLMAHSEVLRCLLEESDIREKEDAKVEDIHPATFKSMLKYVYGHDTTKDMSFDEADNLLYVAEKYLMRRLKNKVATRLIDLLSPDNICSLLNNPACYTQLQLNSAITEILQYDTDRVLDSPQFLGLSPEGFLKILEQEGLAVPEIEVWRAAVKWAKHRVNTEDGTVLRKQISGVENCIRVCTLDSGEFCAEVSRTGILSLEEEGLVCRSIGKKAKQDSLTTFCNEIEPRKKRRRTEDVGKKLLLRPEEYPTLIESPTSYFEVVTKNYPIKLKGVACMAKNRKVTEPEGWKYKVDCTVTIREVTNPHILDHSSEADHDDSPTVVRYSELVKLGCWFGIPLAVDRKNVTLSPHSKYSITMAFTGTIKEYPLDPNKMILDKDDFLLKFSGYHNPISSLYYCTVKPQED